MLNSKSFPECTRIEKEYDVIIVGGGTAGGAAAIAAVNEGLKTLIIERNSFLGGSATGAQVTPMMYSGVADSSNINKLIKQKLKIENHGAADSFGNDGWFNPEMLKFLLEDVYVPKGGEILYDTEYIDSVIQDEKITGLIIHNRGGLQTICGKIIIDCTGDAVVAYKSGVPCFKGNEIDNKNQAVSLRFMLGNIDLKRFCEYLDFIGEPMVLEYPLVEIAAIPSWNRPLSKVFKEAVENKMLNIEDIEYIQAFSVPGMENVLSFNCPEIPKLRDALDPFLISDALVIGRKMIKRLYLFLKANIPGFDNSYIQSVAPMIGIRESRRIKGKYIITEKDYNNRSKFEDAIAKTAYPVDVHGNTAEIGVVIKPMQKGEYFEIPFRCLLPEKINNLLIGGRCISSSFIAQSSIRIQSTCRATGEACGIAAAYSINNNISIKDIDGKAIRQIMAAKGANI